MVPRKCQEAGLTISHGRHMLLVKEVDMRPGRKTIDLGEPLGSAAAKAASEDGYFSLAELVRVLLRDYLDKRLSRRRYSAGWRDGGEACRQEVPDHGQSMCTRDKGHSGPHRCSAGDVDARRAGQPSPTGDP